ncbi:hypothetical protein D1606_00945, partial [Rummeliibacillus sp. POC4]
MNSGSLLSWDLNCTHRGFNFFLRGLGFGVAWITLPVAWIKPGFSWIGDDGLLLITQGHWAR